MTAPEWAVRSFGRHALLIEVADAPAAQTAYRVVQRLVESSQGRLQPPTDIVPAARTVLLDGLADVAGWKRQLETSELDHADLDPPREGSEIIIEVRYDGEDLAAVAAAWDCDRDAVVRRHTEAVFEVAFSGFVPGFAYCTSTPRLPDVARRDEPRTAVPAGAVALAGEWCGVYPTSMPGGWQLIGATDAVLFDVERDPPALLSPGDRVRFEEIR